jgi:predicted transcriptional regulator
MSSGVLIAIRPKWCEMIANGKKTVEVRKTRPKKRTPFRGYIYCTKPSFEHEDFIPLENGRFIYGGGKVIGEFTCDCIDLYVTMNSPNYATFYMKEEDEEILSSIEFNKTCLSEEDFFEYGSGNDLYGWHIAELKVYDKPKELSEFRMYNTGTYVDNGFVMPTKEIKRPPQSWMYVTKNEVEHVEL